MTRTMTFIWESWNKNNNKRTEMNHEKNYSNDAGVNNDVFRVDLMR